MIRHAAELVGRLEEHIVMSPSSVRFAVTGAFAFT